MRHVGFVLQCFCRLGSVFSVAALLWGCDEGPIAPRAYREPSPAPVRYVVSGVVSEETSAGLRPVPDANVEVGFVSPVCGTSRTTTGGDGFYTVAGACGGAAYLAVTKDGYDRAQTAGESPCVGDYGTEYPECRDIFIKGDMRADVLLVRRSPQNPFGQ